MTPAMNTTTRRWFSRRDQSPCTMQVPTINSSLATNITRGMNINSIQIIQPFSLKLFCSLLCPVQQLFETEMNYAFVV